MTQCILLAGATGLIGALVARRLAATPGIELHLVMRRPAPDLDAAVVQHVGPAEEWPKLVRGIEAAVAVSALGTTMRAAGSQPAFRAVDFDLVLAFAAAAREAGARRMIAVSSVGADARSSNFYLRVKGEAEQALGGLGFDRLDLVRPGLLRGQRGGERRIGERLGILLSPVANLFLRGTLAKYAAIDADIVAQAMVALCARAEPGLFIHHNADLYLLASG